MPVTVVEYFSLSHFSSDVFLSSIRNGIDAVLSLFYYLNSNEKQTIYFYSLKFILKIDEKLPLRSVVHRHRCTLRMKTIL